MAQRDIYHNTVIAALAKDGWRITDDPLVLKWGQKDLVIVGVPDDKETKDPLGKGYDKLG